MPPSVAAKTARRLYLQGEGTGMPGVGRVLLTPLALSLSPVPPHNVPEPLCPCVPRGGCGEGSPRPCLRVEVLVLPDALHQLLRDARVEDQVVQEEIVTLGEEEQEVRAGARRATHAPALPPHALRSPASRPWLLTLLGVWGHLFHEGNKVLQELGVVIRQVEVFAILSGVWVTTFVVRKDGKGKVSFPPTLVVLVSPLLPGSGQVPTGPVSPPRPVESHAGLRAALPPAVPLALSPLWALRCHQSAVTSLEVREPQGCPRRCWMMSEGIPVCPVWYKLMHPCPWSPRTGRVPPLLPPRPVSPLVPTGSSTYLGRTLGTLGTGGSDTMPTRPFAPQGQLLACPGQFWGGGCLGTPSLGRRIPALGGAATCTATRTRTDTGTCTPTERTRDIRFLKMTTAAPAACCRAPTGPCRRGGGSWSCSQDVERSP